MTLVPLGSVTRLLDSGARPKGGVSDESGTIPSLGGEHLDRDGGFDFTSIKYIEESFYEAMPKGQIRLNDILIVKDGATTGKVSFVDGMFPFRRAAINEHVFRLTADGARVSPRYLFHFLFSPRGQRELLKDFRGATIGGVSRGILERTLVPLPETMEEQQRIANMLDVAHVIRHKCREALELTDEFLRSAFLDLFGDPVSNPKEWPRSTLASASLKITDGEHLNPKFSDSGMPIVMATNVLDGGVDTSNAKFVPEEVGKKFRKKCGPSYGDILVVSRGATIGRSCIVQTDQDFCLMGSVILIKPRREILNPSFLRELLRHPALRAALFKTSGSSAQQAIYLKDLKDFPIIVPPRELQRQFEDRVEIIQSLSASGRRTGAQADDLFFSLQQRAFQR